ncbi:hypothetical protein F5Y02DRAFT_394741 [Annulohypoxylon stygium]|nr:hypothetical protein F5Y02DRAFT_394741 [Annulohypoxylon stygium]
MAVVFSSSTIFVLLVVLTDLSFFHLVVVIQVHVGGWIVERTDGELVERIVEIIVNGAAGFGGKRTSAGRTMAKRTMAGRISREGTASCTVGRLIGSRITRILCPIVPRLLYSRRTFCMMGGVRGRR